MLSVVKMLLKGEVGGYALNSHGNYIVDHGKSWKNHGIDFFKFLWEPCIMLQQERHKLIMLQDKKLFSVENVDIYL